MAMVTWEYYKKRRNVNFEAFLKGRNIETYEHFCETLQKLGIIAPSQQEFEDGKPKVESKEVKTQLSEPKKKVEVKTELAAKPKRRYTKRKKK